MEQSAVRKPKGDLHVSVEERNKGLKDLDFFADHTHLQNLIQFNARRTVSDMGPLYLRCALTSLSCPECGAEVKRSYRLRPMEWFLKFTGRKVFYCTDCNWREVVKMGEWEWQTILSVLVAFLIVCGASIHWMLR
jgi:hypothetical protein